MSKPVYCNGMWVLRHVLAPAGVARAVVGLRHPLAHLRGAGEAALRRAGLVVEVLGEAPVLAPPERCAEAVDACLRVNEVLAAPAAHNCDACIAGQQRVLGCPVQAPCPCGAAYTLRSMT